MKVLITGGTGTISSGLVREAVNNGYMTYTITRGNNRSRNIDGAISLYADIFDTKQVNRVLEDMKFDVVVECLVYTVEQLKISLNSFASRTQHYIFVSTAGIYSRSGDRLSEEAAKGLVDWAYTNDKIKCEEYLKDFCEKNNVKYTIIRPTVTYGDYRIPFPIATRTPGWTLFKRMIDGLPIVASDNVKYSIIHIDDFSKMVIKLFGNSDAYNNAFHISSNMNDVYWDDIIYEIGRILNVVPKIVHIPVEVFGNAWPEMYDELKYNKNLETILDDKKIKELTNYTTQIDMHEGLVRIHNSMKKEFEENELSADRLWNAKCDIILETAYKDGLIRIEEQDIVKEFISNNIKLINRSRFFIKKNRCIVLMRRVKNKIGRLIGIYRL